MAAVASPTPFISHSFWAGKGAALLGMYGFLAPTGKFERRGERLRRFRLLDQYTASGQTFYLTKNKATAISAFRLYEFHSAQRGTKIQPGQTLNIDYSMLQTIPLKKDMRLQVGLVGYGQWQTTDKSGPNITPEQAKARYVVNALGFGSNVLLPERKVNLSVKYFKEFSNRSTFKGYSLQITGSIKF